MEVYQSSEGIFICQKKYAEGLLKKFSMENCNPVSIPLQVNEKLRKDDGAELADERVYRSIIGSLLYLTAIRPDIMFATSFLSRFMQTPSKNHLAAAKRLLRYVKGTSQYGIFFERSGSVNLVCYTDSDWAGSEDDMKSTSGYTFTLGNGVFSWLSQKQDTIAQSTAEAEYIAACSAVNQAIWLRKIFSDIGEPQGGACTIYCDNKSAIAISNNPVFHRKTKHIKVKYHFIREAENDGQIKLIYCRGQDQLADIFTKALPKGRFEELRTLLGMKQK